MARFCRFLHQGIFKLQSIHFSKNAWRRRSVHAGDPSLKCSRKSNRSHSDDAAAVAAAQFATNNHQPEREGRGRGKGRRTGKKSPPARSSQLSGHGDCDLVGKMVVAGNGWRSVRLQQRPSSRVAGEAGEPAAWSVGRSVGLKQFMGIYCSCLVLELAWRRRRRKERRRREGYNGSTIVRVSQWSTEEKKERERKSFGVFWKAQQPREQ